MDSKIRELRRKVKSAQSLEKCYAYFEELNKLQRERFSRLGKFLPCTDGKVYTFDPKEDMWLSW